MRFDPPTRFPPMKPIPYLLIVSGPLALIAIGLAIRWDLTWLGGMGLFYAGLALAEIGYLLLSVARSARDRDEPSLLSPEA